MSHAVAKGLRAMEIARVNRLPLVSLTESGGADLPKQAEIFVPGGASFAKALEGAIPPPACITLTWQD